MGKPAARCGVRERATSGKISARQTEAAQIERLDLRLDRSFMIVSYVSCEFLLKKSRDGSYMGGHLGLLLDGQGATPKSPQTCDRSIDCAPMPDSLQGRRVVITGASSGIGEATALALAGAGAAVALGARRKDRLDSLAERIAGDGGTAHAYEVDVSDEAAARSFVEGAADQMGGLDILVNNAGLMLLGPIEGADSDEWRGMVDVNLLGLLYCTQAALPLLRDDGGGHIVNLSSVAGRQAALGSGVYNLTKWGVNGFSESLRQEALNSKIRVTIIEPGFTDTELQGHNTHPMVVEATEKMREDIGELLEAEDIAAAILYAVSQPQRVNVNEILIRPTGQRR